MMTTTPGTPLHVGLSAYGMGSVPWFATAVTAQTQLIDSIYHYH